MIDPTTLSPGQLSELLVQQSHEYGNLSDQLSEILKVKPAKWLDMRLDVKSDTHAERSWGRTEEGIQEVTLKLKLKSLEKQMSAIRTRLRVMETEARNMF